MEYQNITPKKDWVDQLNYNIDAWHDAQVVNDAAVFLNGFTGRATFRISQISSHVKLIQLDWLLSGTQTGLTDVMRIPNQYSPIAWTYGIGGTGAGDPNQEWVIETHDEGALLRVFRNEKDEEPIGNITYLHID